ncbi:MAG: 6-aminohexanoate hydrolase, partial [Planctomycetes bacterium]|nr:6-aminohexanoate hydrolase [Planctomycetota bacterium]
MAQGYDYAAAAAYSDLIGGEALVVSVDGTIAYEHYSNGFTATQGHVL